MTFSGIAADVSAATERNICFISIPHEAFVTGVMESGAPADVLWILDYLFATVLDGRNAQLTDGIQRALGRPPRCFSDYATREAAAGTWK